MGRHDKNGTGRTQSLNEEPGSPYLGHLVPSSKKALDIRDAIWSFMEERGHDPVSSQLTVIGSDDESTNTDVHHRVIQLLEEKFQRPVHWIICQLHVNELPLRHLMQNLGGKTSGPSGISGPFGKSLQSCYQLPIVNMCLLEKYNILQHSPAWLTI
jgi:hypothetical protein